jgi:hypothetical protein
VCAFSALIIGRFLPAELAKITTSAATARAISSGPSESTNIAMKYIMNNSGLRNYTPPLRQ